MSAFKKMALVSPDELDRLRQKKVQSYNPTLRTLAFLDEEMDDILNRNDLTVDDKLRLFQTAQTRFKALSSTEPAKILAPQTLQPAPAPPAPAPAQPSIADEPGPSISERTFINHLDTKHRSKAKQLMEYLSTHPNAITSNQNNELVLNGETVAGSNFSDLFSNLYTYNSNSNRRGENDLLKTLNSLNAPTDLLTSTKIKTKLHSLRIPDPPFQSVANTSSSSQTGSGRVRPPGKRPRILRLYRI